jgi:hypothetical protein
MHQNTHGCLSIDSYMNLTLQLGTKHLYCVHHVVYHEGYQCGHNNNLWANKININVLIFLFIIHTTACFDQSDHLHMVYINIHRLPIWLERIQAVINGFINAACTIPLCLSPWRYKEKMATPERKAFCMLQFAKHESVVSVQWAFRWLVKEWFTICQQHWVLSAVSDNRVPL